MGEFRRICRYPLHIFMNILIVEDDLLMAGRLREDLEQAGHNITAHVRSLQDALKSYRNNTPDFAIIDISLGHIDNRDGIELANWLGELNKIPFVFLTGHTTPPQGVEKTRSSNYIVKPYHKFQLLTQIQLNYDRFKEAKEQEAFPECFYIRVNGHLTRIPFGELLYIKAERRSVSVHTVSTGESPYMIGTNLGDILHFFEHPDLVILKPSLVLNKKHIRSIREDGVEIGETGHLVNLSASARKRLIDRVYLIKTRSKA